ncbi:MAG: phosphodiesterase [Clostridia bacterium]|nr:phosphodiesterase [Clostridia bacterium]
MKLLICSDIHGDLSSAEFIINLFHTKGCDKLLLLGDVLYHGPRNDLPDGYNPKGVIELLNKEKDNILAVRGNCDTEVDQMVLDFPILADYAYLSLDGISVLATHGHKYSLSSPPPMKKGEILLCGHTHVVRCESFGEDNVYLNPGSVSIPKENTKKSYIVYENRAFTAYGFDGEIIFKKAF